mmetsp:Transcript_77413/g.149531  ORF Transcript_77413/g.149531 Transcript_77413/m.149531 type:complete len:287 (+) Transcript_77413:132-992(+)
MSTAGPIGARPQRRGGALGQDRGPVRRQWRKRAPEPDGTVEETTTTTTSSPRMVDATSPAVESDLGPRVQLARQLKVVEQQVAQRSAAVLHLRSEIQSLKSEADSALNDAGRASGEASNLQEHASKSEESIKIARSELVQKLDDFNGWEAAHTAQELDWQKDLDGIMHQQTTLAGEVADLERKSSRWRRAASEQAARVARAESRFKNLEAQRAEHLVRVEQMKRQAIEQNDVADETRMVVGDLRAQLDFVTWTSQTQSKCWQALNVVLGLICGWLFWHMAGGVNML